MRIRKGTDTYLDFRNQMNLKWNIIRDFWVPLRTIEIDKEVVFFPLDVFINDFGIEYLEEKLETLTTGGTGRQESRR